MLDFDLAVLYKVPTKVLNQAVKRNSKRFPKDFMFRLNKKEWDLLVKENIMRSQTVTASQKKRNTSTLPFAFSEHGITMLASVLRSERAVKMNIFIVRAFIALRQFAINYNELAAELKDLKYKVGDHDKNLQIIYTALESIMTQKQQQKSWEDRQRIGFKNKLSSI